MQQRIFTTPPPPKPSNLIELHCGTGNVEFNGLQLPTSAVRIHLSMRCGRGRGVTGEGEGGGANLG